MEVQKRVSLQGHGHQVLYGQPVNVNGRQKSSISKKKSTHHTPLLPFSVPSRQRSFPCSPAQVHSASYENDSCFGGAGRVRCNGSEKRRRVKRQSKTGQKNKKCGGTGGGRMLGSFVQYGFTFFRKKITKSTTDCVGLKTVVVCLGHRFITWFLMQKNQEGGRLRVGAPDVSTWSCVLFQIVAKQAPLSVSLINMCGCSHTQQPHLTIKFVTSTCIQ